MKCQPWTIYTILLLPVLVLLLFFVFHGPNRNVLDTFIKLLLGAEFILVIISLCIVVPFMERLRAQEVSNSQVNK